jgi:hypothetical protein
VIVQRIGVYALTITPSMMIDLITQPCMASKLTNFVEIITQISAAQSAVLLLDQSPDWVVAAHAAESIKAYTVFFPKMRWDELDYLSRECLQIMRQGPPTGQTRLLGSGLICSYFPLVLETHLHSVLCIVHRPGLAERTHDLANSAGSPALSRYSVQRRDDSPVD